MGNEISKRGSKNRGSSLKAIKTRYNVPPKKSYNTSVRRLPNTRGDFAKRPKVNKTNKEKQDPLQSGIRPDERTFICWESEEPCFKDLRARKIGRASKIKRASKDEFWRVAAEPNSRRKVDKAKLHRNIREDTKILRDESNLDGNNNLEEPADQKKTRKARRKVKLGEFFPSRPEHKVPHEEDVAEEEDKDWPLMRYANGERAAPVEGQLELRLDFSSLLRNVEAQEVGLPQEEEVDSNGGSSSFSPAHLNQSG